MTIFLFIVTFYLGIALGFFICALLTHGDTPRPREKG